MPDSTKIFLMNLENEQFYASVKYIAPYIDKILPAQNLTQIACILYYLSSPFLAPLSYLIAASVATSSTPILKPLRPLPSLPPLP